MKKEIKIFSSIILVVSLAVTVFSACNSDSNNNEPVQSTESTVVYATDYTYSSILNTIEKETEYMHTVPPLPTEITTKKTIENKNETTSVNEEKTTNKKPTGDKVEEIANGLSLITKTSPVVKGNAATIVIQGTPSTEYSIEFYKNNTQKASYYGLSNTSSDSSGFAMWTFLVDEDCEIGERKIIIKEKNSDKYIQTSITVQ